MTNAEYAKAWRLKNAEKVRAYRKANQAHRSKMLAGWKERNPERHRETAAKWRAKNRKNIRKRHREWEKNNPRQREKYNHSPQQKARMILYVERRAGRIVRPSNCGKCGVECVPHGHHPDYSKPLEVIWLCVICHAQVHCKVS